MYNCTILTIAPQTPVNTLLEGELLLFYRVFFRECFLDIYLLTYITPRYKQPVLFYFPLIYLLWPQ